MRIDAEVVARTEIEAIIARMFADPKVGYIHVHHAKQGCYSGRIECLALIRSCAARGTDLGHPYLHLYSANPLLAQITHGRGIETTIHI
ncbi:DUF1203 domain-containing protein [Pseudomonas eucalypticola]|uniref:DUF1203 domain-containing protein n=1 Tax=Pseudomonas eucalypticola TaxID=2599595 RepID=UPI001FD7F754